METETGLCFDLPLPEHPLMMHPPDNSLERTGGSRRRHDKVVVQVAANGCDGANPGRSLVPAAQAQAARSR
jgi:hypothetical protein